MIKKLINILILCFLLNFFSAFQDIQAQEYTTNEVEMADKMRSDGKIYVVIVVVAVVFTGITIFAINTDRKVTRLEKEVKNLKSDNQA